MHLNIKSVALYWPPHSFASTLINLPFWEKVSLQDGAWSNLATWKYGGGIFRLLSVNIFHHSQRYKEICWKFVAVLCQKVETVSMRIGGLLTVAYMTKCLLHSGSSKRSIKMTTAFTALAPGSCLRYPGNIFTPFCEPLSSPKLIPHSLKMALLLRARISRYHQPSPLTDTFSSPLVLN